MKKIIMMKGLPASGKSTWAKENANDNLVRINKDDLRAMMGGGFTKLKEKAVLAMRDAAVDNLLSNGISVIVDDSNFAPKHEETLKELATLYKAQLQIKFIDTPVQECIQRDTLRTSPVGEKVIMDMYNQYLKPEEIDKELLHDPLLPNCIIVDIDGTLAHMNGRSPYDYTKVNEDIVDETIKDLVAFYGNKAKVFVVSGRKAICYEMTRDWLIQNDIRHDHLAMRATDDDRKDYIVKQEIYTREIKGKYNVLFVLDDRDQVVKMWRKEGLKCLQVAEGNF